ncbi:MAG: AAA family ATPase [Firmicutes bacterium]|nr:AAA family ATPase [Bacillota bacterium]
MVEETLAPAAPAAALPAAAVVPAAGDGGQEERLPTGLGEVDRVLGGGLVPGALILLGGDPGVGKSTLLLQVAAALSRDGPVLYVSGEESLRQVRMRARRLGADGSGLYLLAESNLDAVTAAVRQQVWRLVVVDSLQTVYHPGLESAPGSVGQVREVAARLMRLAKGADGGPETPVIVVGHVTKEGSKRPAA